MKINHIEDMQIWTRARLFVGALYRAFSGCRDYSFRDQIQRASVSIMNNVAEGFERQTNKEFKHFLYISKGSCGEVRSMLCLALDLGYIKKSNYDSLSDEVLVITKMISSLIKTMT